jgi:predicted lipid-binding transport protein (Tim44 family)
MENQRSNATNQKAQQKQFGLPSCPYCGAKVNPILAWGIKSKGEFGCPHCGSYSNVKLARPVYWMGLLSILLAGILLLIFFFTGCMHLQLLVCMLIPFFLFTASAPFFVYLERILPPGYRPPKTQQSRPAGGQIPKKHSSSQPTKVQRQSNRSQQNTAKKSDRMQ